MYKSKIDDIGEVKLLMKDKDGEVKPLTRYEPSEAQETLGVFIAMDGNWRCQKEVLKLKAATFASQLRSRHLDHK